MSPPLSAAKTPDPEQAPDPRVAGARDVVRLLVKAQKAQRLYEGKNAVSARLENELYDRLHHHLDELGDIHLNVQEFVLRMNSQVVYESADRNDSLAFLLYRDGIRRLSICHGLSRDELRSFLDCLNRVAKLSNDQDDLVTLLWELELTAIRYFAVEELDANESYPRLQDQLASGETATGEASGGGEGVSLDLEQPLTTVPVEASRLGDHEIESLQRELASEESAPFHQLVSELALELTLLESEEASLEELRQSLVAIIDRLIEEGELLDLVGLHEHLIGLSTMVFSGSAPVARLVEVVQSALAEDARLGIFLEKVDTLHAPKPETLTAFFARLGADRSGTLIDWMGRFSSPAYRRAVTNALLAVEDRGLQAVSSALPDGPAPARDTQEHLRHRQFVRETLHALGRLQVDAALPLLERLVDAADGETRRESFTAMSRYPDPRVDAVCLDRLEDGDGEIRSTALDTLVRRARPELGAQILERALSRGFDERPLAEKRRLFAGVAKIAGESILPKLRELLRDSEGRWFATSKEKHLAEAVAHAVRVVGTPGARTLLKECANKGTRAVRAACQKELSAGR